MSPLRSILTSAALLACIGFAAAADQPNKPSGAVSKYQPATKNYALHNIGTGDGFTSRKTLSNTNHQKSYLGDTATHEVGHYHKRIDKATPLRRSGSAVRMGK